ncbi:MAG TPA: NADH-quinone oxidoreductase subunit NuoK [Anaerolineaceae bacterium]|jgi:NADH-quinone oxidoreductase subunit K|nr:NADH-quinone oxidoreductase subunit NuoK [Anaerolineaceae bacterium]NMD31864.1 NADH-quinone oxidoreductase subunit NuoK [Chloroflexota bacterium]HNS64684.1 NADH-quinone oxidoreductase subunit NuoK [Anaerolineaceae bacterium]HNZ01097.1 NADH-quinone oxidoreductase subunit NuoK [Anaerolineaceae bacterium]HOD44347.1 NADH-quinone oxidoreductase subunit NuoK [Anaerolineaceae bacterium]
MPITYYLILSAILFVLGIAGMLIRRNAIVVFMSMEMMFNAANLLFVAYASYYQILTGQLFVFFVMTVAAAEVAIGLALIVAIYRNRKQIDVDDMSSLKG